MKLYLLQSSLVYSMTIQWDSKNMKMFKINSKRYLFIHYTFLAICLTWQAVTTHQFISGRNKMPLALWINQSAWCWGLFLVTVQRLCAKRVVSHVVTFFNELVKFEQKYLGETCLFFMPSKKSCVNVKYFDSSRHTYP